MTKSRLIKTLPCYGDVDMTRYEGIVCDPRFTRLSRIQQVPLAEHIYPGCKHTREEHSIGSFYVASRLAESLHLYPEETEALKIAALLHDIGHGAHSHATEFITQKIGLLHDNNTAKVIDGMKDVIAGMGFVDPDKVLNITQKRDELSPVVSSITGADKMDYVGMDLYHCGMGEVAAIERLITYAMLVGNNGSRKYGVAYKDGGGDALSDFLKAWWSAHRTIYLRPSVEIRRAMFQRAVYYTIYDGELDKLFEMDDAELMVMAGESHDENARRLVKNVKNYNLHKPVAVFKLDGYNRYTDDGDAKVCGLTSDEQASLPRDIDTITRDEAKLCDRFGIPTGSLIMTRSEDVERMDPRRKECNIIMDGELPSPLGDIYPDMVEFLMEEARRQYAFRIVVEPEYAGHVRQLMGGMNPKSLFM